MADGGELQGKRALVTGSTQGLGAGIARRFVAAGARVVVTGRDRARGEAVARDLGPGCAGFVRADLARVEDCAALARDALARLGGLDLLVNSAGLPERSTLASFSPEHFDRVMHVNVRAPLLLAQAAAAALRERAGVIINIGSVNAYIGAASLLGYSASKGALVTASRNLASALRGDRIRVHVLNTGWMDTEGERAIQAGLGQPADYLDQAAGRMPAGRLISPAEVAEICVALGRDECAVFSGAVLDLDQIPVGSWGLAPASNRKAP